MASYIARNIVKSQVALGFSQQQLGMLKKSSVLLLLTRDYRDYCQLIVRF